MGTTLNTFQPLSEDRQIIDEFWESIQELLSTLSLEDIEDWIRIKTEMREKHNGYPEWKFIDGLLSRYSTDLDNHARANSIDLYILVMTSDLEFVRKTKVRDNKIRQI